MRKRTKRVACILLGTICLTTGCSRIDNGDVVNIIEDAHETVKVIANLSEETTAETEMNITASELPESDSELYAVTLVRVVDGDTLVVNDNGTQKKIRLIGIDTPESVHSDASQNNEYGELASSYTKDILSGKETIYLQYDEGKTDMYGRTLAYVWLTSDVDIYDISDIQSEMLNGILVCDGYAYDKTYEPNDMYADTFHLLRCNAEGEERGLWIYNEFAMLWD